MNRVRILRIRIQTKIRVKIRSVNFKLQNGNKLTFEVVITNIDITVFC